MITLGRYLHDAVLAIISINNLIEAPELNTCEILSVELEVRKICMASMLSDLQLSGQIEYSKEKEYYLLTQKGKERVTRLTKNTCCLVNK